MRGQSREKADLILETFGFSALYHIDFKEIFFAFFASIPCLATLAFERRVGGCKFRGLLIFDLHTDSCYTSLCLVISVKKSLL